jgi:thioesterase domain-containing protein
MLKQFDKSSVMGPYALAGYSYGAMLAFEIAKRLDATRCGAATGAVQFLGSFNLPPHIKSRMRELRWNLCLLHLTQFLGLTSESDVKTMEQSKDFSTKPKIEALEQVMSVMDRSRWIDLGLEQPALARWADVAYGLQSMAVEYEPSGVVSGIDVFHAIPLQRGAASREEWIKVHLSKWSAFARSEPRFHEVGGAHYTMIGPEHVTEFAATLKKALHARGL